MVENQRLKLREIRAGQDEEFRKSLEAGIEKEEQKKREGYLKNLMAYRQSMLLTEPFMTKDTVLVCVWHMTLGKNSVFLFTREMYTDIPLDRKPVTWTRIF